MIWLFGHDSLRRHTKISSRQLRLSSHNTRLFIRFLQTSCLQDAPLERKSHTVRIFSTLLSFGVQAHFNCGRRHAAFSSVTFRRLQSSEMGFADSPPDNTIRITMTIPTQIQNQPPVSYSFVTFQIKGTVVATIHELQNTGGRRDVTFTSEVIRLMSTTFVPRSASLRSPGLARISTTTSARNSCTTNSRPDDAPHKWKNILKKDV